LLDLVTALLHIGLIYAQRVYPYRAVGKPLSRYVKEIMEVAPHVEELAVEPYGVFVSWLTPDVREACVS